jgi:N-acetylglucosaminyl-diphospho-decaprenol L-rhamnosyltransferase
MSPKTTNSAIKNGTKGSKKARLIPSLDIVIVNWNSGDQLRNCLDSIVASNKQGFSLKRVVVVDNASTDESLRSVETMDLPLVVVHNARNRGFGAACNQGAYQSATKYLLFLNPDTRVFGESLVRPILLLEEPGYTHIGIVGIQLVDGHGNIWRTCSRFPTAGSYVATSSGLDRFLPDFFKHHLMLDWDHRDSREVDHVMGAFYLVRTALFRQLGGFDERYFVYLEDIDFSLRAKQVGSAVYFYARASAFHKGGGVSDQIKSLRLFYSIQSRIQYAFKHFTFVGANVVLLSSLFIEPFARILLATTNLSLTAIVQTLKAYVLVWRAVPSLLANGKGIDK